MMNYEDLESENIQLRKEITELKGEAFDALTIIESFKMNDDPVRIEDLTQQVKVLTEELEVQVLKSGL